MHKCQEQLFIDISLKNPFYILAPIMYKIKKGFILLGKFPLLRTWILKAKLLLTEFKLYTCFQIFYWPVNCGDTGCLFIFQFLFHIICKSFFLLFWHTLSYKLGIGKSLCNFCDRIDYPFHWIGYFTSSKIICSVCYASLDRKSVV